MYSMKYISLFILPLLLFDATVCAANPQGRELLSRKLTNTGSRFTQQNGSSYTVPSSGTAKSGCAEHEIEMIAESVRYLHKSIPQPDGKLETKSLHARIVPITTVVEGLLDAGVSVDEPIVKAALEFLESISDGKYSIRNTGGEILKDETRLLRKCLAKAKKASRKHENDSTTNVLRIEQILDSFADVEAIRRSKQFLANHSGTEPTVISTTPQEFVMSTGTNANVRFRDAAQPSMLNRSELSVHHWSDADYSSLVSAVYNGGMLPANPFKREDSNRKTFLVRQSLTNFNTNDRDRESLPKICDDISLGDLPVVMPDFGCKNLDDRISGYILVIRTNSRRE